MTTVLTMMRRNMESNCKPCVPVDTWWTGRNIEIVQPSDGQLYALHNWNGEKYIDCWKCIDRYTQADDNRYTLIPVYRFQIEGIDLSVLEENSADWEKAVEIVDYIVS